MPYIMVDVEADGPIPGDFSMVRLGAIVVEPELNRTFDGFFCPLSLNFDPEALAISGFTREQTLQFSSPAATTRAFIDWVKTIGVEDAKWWSRERPMFIADNNGFDWQFVNWYCWHFCHENPFGHSSTNLGSLYKGMVKDVWKGFKHLRQTKHDHNPVNDARGNAEAMLTMKTQLGLKF